MLEKYKFFEITCFRLFKNIIYTLLLWYHFIIRMVAHELKRNLVAVCLLFRDKNYSFNYRKVPTPNDLPKSCEQELDTILKQLRSDVSKGKGAINLLILLGGLAGIILGFLKWNG